MDDTIPSTEGRVSVGSGGVDPFDKLNHDNRLGTFSFASTDPHSGSTTVKGVQFGIWWVASNFTSKYTGNETIEQGKSACIHV